MRSVKNESLDIYTHDDGLAKAIYKEFLHRMNSNTFLEDEGLYSFYDIPRLDILSFLEKQEKAMPLAEYEAAHSHSENGIKFARIRVFSRGKIFTFSGREKIKKFLKNKFKNGYASCLQEMN